MPLLNDQNDQAVKQTALLLKRGPLNIFNFLLNAWKQQFTALWSGDTEAILAELGTDAAELFELSGKLVVFLETLKPGCTAETLAARREIVVHQDGSVTLASE